MQKIITKLTLALIAFNLLSCGAYFNQPVEAQGARTGELTEKTKVLRKLPLPSEKVVVGVYNFKDQTGQYKNLENGSSFSTAVPQGATTMLIQALEDSKWFTPIERENLANLLNERNIIRSTREEFARSTNTAQPLLPPLLYAGVLLEGAIVSYDTNVLTGGAGARYFGAGASTQYRQDRISIYLRAVSTSNGKILKTVYVSKTILSQSLDASLFRYVSFQRLLEAETGFTKNEPVQLALKGAIEKAVEALIIEGVGEGLWTSLDGSKGDEELLSNYREEKRLEEIKLLHDREQASTNTKSGFKLGILAPYLDGDYSKKDLGYGARIGFSKRLSSKFDLALEVDYLSQKTGNAFSQNFIASQFNIEFDLLPYDNFSPFIYGGGGLILATQDPEPPLTEKVLTPKMQVGGGLSYSISTNTDFRIFAEGNFSFSDELDGIENGKRDDFYYNFGIALNFKFGSN